MTLTFSTLGALRTHHPAWRLLCSDHAPLVASFLQRVFVVPNVRVMAAADLAEALEDELYALRLQLAEKGENPFPNSALEYLNDWAAPDKGWLRKFYRPGTDEAQFDLTPSTEKAIAWLAQLSERQFVGTESRLLTLFDLLKQMSEGSEADPAKRIAELHKKRDDIDAEIARVLAGDVAMLDDTALKDRVLALPVLTDLSPDTRTRRVHYDWMEAGEHTQRMVAALSQQLRRFLDDQAWLENRRIMDILHGIESKALALRDAPPVGSVMEMTEACADIELAMERPLFTPAIKPVITDLALQAGDADIDPSALFEQVVVDKARLTRHIRHALQDRGRSR
jgi:hypothetical protein